MDCGRDRAVRQPGPSHVRPLAHSERCHCIKTPGRPRCTANRLPLRYVRFRPKPVAFIPPAWFLPGIICRPSSTLRLPTSNILPFGCPDPSSDSCRWLARNHRYQHRRGGDLPGPLSGTSTSLSVGRACLMQPRDSVASRNGAVRHWDHYNPTSERCQRIFTTILPQEIHRSRTRLCITVRRPDQLLGGWTWHAHPVPLKRKKPDPCGSSFLVPIVTARLSVPRRGRNPRRHEYFKDSLPGSGTQPHNNGNATGAIISSNSWAESGRIPPINTNLQ